MTSPRLLIFTRVLRRWAQTTEGKVTGKKKPNCDHDLTIIAEQRSPLWRITWHSWVDFRFNLFRISRSQSLSLFLGLTSVQTGHLNYIIMNAIVIVTAVSVPGVQPVHQNLTRVTLGQRSCGMSVIQQCASGDDEPQKKARPPKTCCFLFSLQTPKSVKVFFFT